MEQRVPESFQEGLQELQQVVAGLREPELALEEAVRLYERGRFLSEYCHRQLDAAEGRIMALRNQEGDAQEEIDFGVNVE